MRENIEGARLSGVLIEKRKNTVFKVTLGAAYTIPDNIPGLVVIDPTAARSVTMPDKLLVSDFTLVNAADAAEVITLLDDDVSSTTAGACTQGEIAYCVSDGVKWYVTVGVA